MNELNASTLDIRTELMNVLENLELGAADGFWDELEIQINDRNSFCLRVEPDGPIFTIRAEYGGVLRK